MKYLKKYESPDNIKNIKKNIYFKYNDKDAVPFGYKDGKMLVGRKGFHETHSDLTNDDNVNKHFLHHDIVNRKDFKYSGRIWVNKEVISFWDYPDNYTELKKVLKDIENVYNEQHLKKIEIDDDWWIEVIFKNNKQIINKYKYWGDSEIDGDKRYLRDSRLIKIGDYKGSDKRSSKELAKKHIETGSGGKIPGFGSEYYTGKLQKGMSQSEYKNKKTKYKFTENFELFEYADSIEYKKDGKIFYADYTEGIPFALNVKNDDLIIGEKGTIHISNNIDYPHWKGHEDSDYNYHGRLWLELKLISFWNYPTQLIFRKIINDLEKKLKIKILNNGWKVEILKTKEGIINKNYKLGNDDIKKYYLELIPIEDYIGSKKVPKKLLNLHLIKSDDKYKLMKYLGYKQKNIKTPKNMSQIEYRDKKTRYKFTENFKLFVKENKKEKNNFKIYVDMDGVLTDFKRQLKETWLDKYNKENNTKFKDGWSFEEKVGTQKFWKNVSKIGLKFWSDMPWKKDGKKLWNFIKNKNVEILSTPSRDKNSKIGKRIWCEREISKNIKLILTFKKQIFANSNSILIDDLKKNIDKWNKAGGIGILHKNTDDTIEKLKNIIDEKL